MSYVPAAPGTFAVDTQRGEKLLVVSWFCCRYETLPVLAAGAGAHVRQDAMVIFVPDVGWGALSDSRSWVFHRYFKDALSVVRSRVCVDGVAVDLLCRRFAHLTPIVGEEAPV